MPWVRTCQECDNKQFSKPPGEYRGDSWRDTPCRKCKSSALDYGKNEDVSPSRAIVSQPKPKE